MCLIVIGINVRDDYPLVLLANRDEFYNRPTINIHRWESGSIVAGKDLMGNGTWLGVNKTGKLAAITNYRDLKNLKENAPSRGLLTLNYLQSELSPADYINSISKEANKYNGFNLLLGQSNSYFHFSNIDNKITELNQGYYGLSNALLDTPWPKVVKSKSQFKDALSKSKIDENEVLNILRNGEMANENFLPDTGVPIDLEKKLSSMFINFPGYGTRCTSLIKKDKLGILTFTEVVYDEQGNEVGYEEIKV